MKHRAVFTIALAVLTAATISIAVPATSSAAQRSSQDLRTGSTEKVESQHTKAGEPGVRFDGGPQVIAAEAPAWTHTGSSSSVIGSMDTDQLAPDGIGLVGLPSGGGAPDSGAFSSPSALSGGYGCKVSCIEEGLAYARGLAGAELVVSTSVPTTLFFGVIQLTPGYPAVDTTTLYSMDTSHSWVLDQLDPGMSYGVTVVATDGDGNSDLAYGEFTTLSTRDVSVEIGDVVIAGGPELDATTTLWLGVDDEDLLDVTPGQGGVPTFEDVDRHSDFGLLVMREFEPVFGPLLGECQEAFGGINGRYPLPDQGHDAGACRVWNTAHIHDLDLDVAPAGVTRWNSTSFTAGLYTPNGAGDALPADWAEDWWLDVVATATFHVTYS